MSPRASALPDGTVLLNVDVLLRNVGKVAIMPRFGGDAAERDRGLQISIAESSPSARDDGAAPSPDEPTVAWFDWSYGDGRPRPIMHKRNLLATNKDFHAGRCQLNPGVQYREPLACIVDPDRIYAIRARFWTDEGSVADLVYVDTFIEPRGGTP